jgi:hypothetical protein
MEVITPFLTPQMELKKLLQKNFDLIKIEEKRKKQDEALYQLESFCGNAKIELENPDNWIGKMKNSSVRSEYLKKIEDSILSVENIYNSNLDVDVDKIQKKLNELKKEKEKLGC